MYRYTTPTLQFNLPIETNILDECYVTIKQSEGVLIEKQLAEMTAEDKTLKITLTQEETALLKANEYMYIQLRCKDKNANAYASKIFKIATEQVLKEGVI